MEESIWYDYKNYNASYTKLNRNITTEVCIVGGGITGISIAYELMKKNIPFILLEKDTIADKVTSKSSAKVTSQHGLIYHEIAKKYGLHHAKLYLEANEKAIKNIEKIVEEENINCDFREEAHYIYTQDKNRTSAIQDEYITLKKLDQKHIELVKKLPIPLECVLALKVDKQACFNPRNYTLGLAKILSKKRKCLYEHVTINQIKKEKNHYLIFTDKAQVTAKRVILATHYPIKDIPGFYFFKMYQDTSYVIAVDIEKQDYTGMYIRVEEPIFSLRAIKKKERTILLAGGNGHKTGDVNIENRYQFLESYVKKMYPNSKVLKRWNTQDCISLDNIPYIGEFSTYFPNFYVATGFNKWGMTTSNIAAHIIVDKILKRKNPYEEVFKATRYHAFKNIPKVYHMLNQTTRSLLFYKLKIKKDLIDTLPNNTGKIMKVEGKKVGVYKDEKGKVYTIFPYCSHLKCLLTFNALDKTWDCPCHGSRFDIYGNVLNSPASKALK